MKLIDADSIPYIEGNEICEMIRKMPTMAQMPNLDKVRRLNINATEDEVGNTDIVRLCDVREDGTYDYSEFIRFHIVDKRV